MRAPNSPQPPTQIFLVEQESGLIAKGGGVVLKGVHVRAKLIDLVGRVVVMQHYTNDSSQPIEANYVFPLDEFAGSSLKEVGMYEPNLSSRSCMRI